MEFFKSHMQQGETAWRNGSVLPCLKNPQKPQNLPMDQSSRPKRGKKGSKISHSMTNSVNLALCLALRKGWLAEST